MVSFGMVSGFVIHEQILKANQLLSSSPLEIQKYDAEWEDERQTKRTLESGASSPTVEGLGSFFLCPQI